jgi:hypothetical protein
MTGERQERDDHGMDDGDPGDDVEETPSKPWSTTTQAVAAVGWSSFLAACFATMLFFAFIDPGLIHPAITPHVEITRMTGYGIGFFFFWLVCAIAGAVAVYLVRTAHTTDQDQDAP